jgi:hypothetical protein
MLVCMTTKVVQSFISTILQISYLATHTSLDDPTMSSQGKALFALSILASIFGVLFGMLTLCMKNSFLRQIESDDTLSMPASTDDGHDDPVDKSVKIYDVYRGSRGSVGESVNPMLGDTIGGGNCSGNALAFVNPMHSTKPPIARDGDEEDPKCLATVGGGIDGSNAEAGGEHDDNDDEGDEYGSLGGPSVRDDIVMQLFRDGHHDHRGDQAVVETPRNSSVVPPANDAMESL